MSKLLVAVQDRLLEVIRDIGDEGLSSREVVARLRKRFPTVVEAAAIELEDLALVGLVTKVRKKRAPASVEFDYDLFLGLKIDRTLSIKSTRAGEAGKRVNKHTHKMTKPEILDYLDEHNRARETDKKNVESLRLLLVRAEPYMVSLDVDLGTALLEARKSEEA